MKNYQPKNKFVRAAGAVTEAFVTLVIYVAIIATGVVFLMWLGVTLGEWVHTILNR